MKNLVKITAIVDFGRFYVTDIAMTWLTGGYVIETRETGDALCSTRTLSEAEQAIVDMEERDRAAGIYSPRSYAIRHGDECEIR